MSDYVPDEYTAKQMYVLERQSMHNHISPDYGAEFDRFIADVRADAWDEGLQAGWEECQNPDPFVNDWWDSKAPNPHRVEGEA